MIQIHVLRDGEMLGDVALPDLAGVRAQPRTLTWVDVASPTAAELASLGAEFDIHEIALEDVEIGQVQRPKIEQYPDHVLMVFYGAADPDGGGSTSLWELDLIAGGNYLLTLHRGGLLDADEVARRITARPELATDGVGYLLYVVLDETVDTFFPALDRIGERVVDLEDSVLAGDPNLQQQIFPIRKDLIAVRRVIGPMRDAMVVLLRRDVGLFSHQAQAYLRDVYDHLIRLGETVEDYQDLTAGALDANATMAANRVNTVARNLAAYAAIFAVVTMISGVYGMNFDHIPELHWGLGYAWALGLMVVCAGGLWIYFKRKGWL
jgi:magnesium transporter